MDAVLLRDKIKEKGLNISKLSDEMNMSRSTLYRKMNNDGETFLVKEVMTLADILNLNADEFNHIFFNSKSHKCD